MRGRGPRNGTEPAVAEVTIRRAVADVYAFYTDMRNMPLFLGDVLAVRITGARTARWTVALPLGLRIRWTTTVTDDEPERRFSFRTSTAGMTTTWTVTFLPVADGTRVREEMALPGGRAGRVVLALLGKHPDGEVRSNLHRLQQVLEDGRATDPTNTMGKRFGP